MSTQKRYTVAVLGAAGGIGQPLALLLKNSPLVGRLVLFDVIPAVTGVAVDLSHIETPAKVISVTGDLKDQALQKRRLLEALQGVEIAVIPAGIPRKPGMTREDLFSINAGIVQGLIEGICEACPNAMTCVISNPVNSTVPIAAEVMKKYGVYNPKRLFGVSTLDVVRANTFISEKLGKSPNDFNVTVIGGHSGVTILPVLSEFSTVLDQKEIEALTDRIQNAGTEVVDAKAGAGSATLSMAYAGARFVLALMKAMNGEKGVVECSYVASDVMPGCEFFASKVTLGPSGITKVHGLGNLSAFEKDYLENKVVPELKAGIQKGVDFVNK